MAEKKTFFEIRKEAWLSFCDLGPRTGLTRGSQEIRWLESLAIIEIGRAVGAKSSTTGEDPTVREQK